MPTFLDDDLAKLIAHLQAENIHICASLEDFYAPLESNPETGPVRRLWIPTPRKEDGTVCDGQPSDMCVTEALYERLKSELVNEDSDFAKWSTRAIERAFVYLDISDFSKFSAHMQQLVITSLVGLKHVRGRDWPLSGIGGMPETEAELCIGDGFVYVFKDAVEATLVACYMAKLVEKRVAERLIPSFHFRIGVHVGAVRRFWDPGRKDWNYVGDAINGGNRVLGAIGKSTDDVVYVSDAVRAKLQIADQIELLHALQNRGRHNDKHGNPWRVYQVNHDMVLPKVLPRLQRT